MFSFASLQQILIGGLFVYLMFFKKGVEHSRLNIFYLIHFLLYQFQSLCLVSDLNFVNAWFHLEMVSLGMSQVFFQPSFFHAPFNELVAKCIDTEFPSTKVYLQTIWFVVFADIFQSWAFEK